MNAVASFSYGDLDTDVAVRMRGQAERIRTRIAGQTEAMIETGRDLAAVKGEIEHGAFQAWVEAECGISPRTAQLYMRAAEWAEVNAKSISFLPPTVVLKLAGKSVPEEIQRDVISRYEGGDRIPASLVEGLISQDREKRRKEAEEAKVLPRTRKAREKRRAQEEEDRARAFREARKCDERARAMAIEFAAILKKHLPEEDFDRATDILMTEGVRGGAYRSGVREIFLQDAMLNAKHTTTAESFTDDDVPVFLKAT